MLKHVIFAVIGFTTTYFVVSGLAAIRGMEITESYTKRIEQAMPYSTNAQKLKFSPVKEGSCFKK
jgi:hypothetical protein